MPQIPYQGYGQAPRFIPTAPETINAPPGAFGTGVGAAEQGLGRDISQAGNLLEQPAINLANTRNIAEANELFIQGETQLGQIEANYKTLTGKAAADGFASYQQQVQDARKDILSKASNPDVSTRLNEIFSRRVGFALTDGAGHAATETKNYGNQMDSARVQLATSNAANAKDDNDFKTNLQTGLDHIDSAAIRNGTDAASVTLEKKKFTSDSWVGRIQQIAQKDPWRAQALLEQGKGDMLADSYFRGQKLVEQGINTVGAKLIVDQVKNGQAEGFDLPAAKKAMFGNESGGNYGVRGDVLPSGDRAYGAYQVMGANVGPWTQQVLGHRMTPEEFLKDPAAQDAVFKGIFGGYVQKYGIQGAAAAWHSGTPTIDDSKNDYHMVNGKMVGIKTADYVSNFMTTYQAASGGYHPAPAGPLTSTSDEGHLKQMITYGQTIAEKRDPGNAVLAHNVEMGLRGEFNVVQAEKRDITNQNESSVMNSVVGDATHPPARSLDDIVGPNAAPGMREAYYALPPEKRAAIDTALVRNSKGQDVPMTEARNNRFLQLTGMAQNDPNGFMKLPLVGEDLPKSEIGKLLTMKENIVKNAGKPIDDTKYIKFAQPQLNAAGITRPKPGESSPEYDQFTGALHTELENWKNANKKEPDEETVRKITSQLLRTMSSNESKGQWWSNIGKSDVFGDRFSLGNLFDSTVRAYQVPAAEREKIISGYKKAFGGAEPTEAQIYRKWTTQGQR